MNGNIKKVFDLFAKLKKTKIYYALKNNRENALTVEVAVPGQRWEIDFFADGTTEVEIFSSDGNIYDELKLIELFQNYSDS